MQDIGYAKINLALHVRGREADGYHRIETLFAFCEEGDLLEAEEAEDLSLQIRGPFAHQLGSDGINLVLRAAEALRRRFGNMAGAALTLDKRLPVASGLGGGSADAAAALRLLALLWSLPAGETDLLEVARTLGADVPACLLSRSCRGGGRGDRLEEEDGAASAGLPVLLVNPAVPLSTAKVFQAWRGVDGGALPRGEPIEVALQAHNDLEPAAMSLVPEVGEVLDALAEAPGAMLVRMSGSGATCFALFATDADRDAAACFISRSQPGWWQLPTRLR